MLNYLINCIRSVSAQSCRNIEILGSFFTPHKVPADRKYLVPLENIEYEYYRYNGQNRICAGKSLSIHGKAVWHGILELTASFTFGNTTIWFPDENVPGN